MSSYLLVSPYVITLSIPLSRNNLETVEPDSNNCEQRSKVSDYAEKLLF